MIRSVRPGEMIAGAHPVILQALTMLVIILAMAAQQAAHAYPNLVAGCILPLLAAGLFVTVRRLPPPAPPALVTRPGRNAPGVRILVGGVGAVAALAGATRLSATNQWPGLALGMWVAALACAAAGLTAWRVSPPARDPEPVTRNELAALSAILLVAALARVAWINALPRYYFGDEPRVAAFLLGAYRQGLPNFFAVGWNTWSVLGLSLQGIFAPILGLSTTTLRLSSALVGTLAVLATYLLARELFTPKVALLAALLLAVCRTAIDFSRLGTCHAQVMLFETLAFFWWWRAINRGAAVSYLWAGIALALCLYCYNAGQLAPVLWGSWLTLCVVAAPRSLRSHASGALVTLVGFLLAAFPWLFSVTDHATFGPYWHDWVGMGRSRQVVTQIIDAWHGPGAGAALRLLDQQVWRTWLGFGVIPAGAYGLGYRGGGMLDNATAPLFVLGLAMCIKWWRHPRTSFVAYWWLVTAVSGSVLTFDPPAFVRMVGILPALAIVAALPLDALSRWNSSVKAGKVIAVALAVTILAGAAWENWRTYFVSFADDPVDDMSELARVLQRVPPNATVLLVGAEHHLNFDNELFLTEFSGRRFIDLPNAADALPFHHAIETPLVLILSESQTTLSPYVHHLYPHTQSTDVIRKTDHQLLFRMLQIDPEEVRVRAGLLRPDVRTEGLAAVYERDGRTLWRGVEPQVNSFAVEALFPMRINPVDHAEFEDDLPLRMPFSATWQGALRIVDPGVYEFDAVGSGPYAVVLDTQPLLEASDVVPEEPKVSRETRSLTAGLHRIAARWDSTKAAHTSRRVFQVYWTPPGGQRELIPPSSLVPEP